MMARLRWKSGIHRRRTEVLRHGSSNRICKQASDPSAGFVTSVTRAAAARHHAAVCALPIVRLPGRGSLR